MNSKKKSITHYLCLFSAILIIGSMTGCANQNDNHDEINENINLSVKSINDQIKGTDQNPDRFYNLFKNYIGLDYRESDSLQAWFQFYETENDELHALWVYPAEGPTEVGLLKFIDSLSLTYKFEVFDDKDLTGKIIIEEIKNTYNLTWIRFKSNDTLEFKSDN